MRKNIEVIQSWEAVKSLNSSLVAGDQAQSLDNCRNAVTQAVALYETIQGLSIRLDSKSNQEHLQPLADGIRLFAKLAELE